MKHRGGVVLLLLLCLGCGSGEPEPLLVGHVAPRTDADDNAGQFSRRGVHLAVTEFQADKKTALPRPIVVLHANADPTRSQFAAEAVRLTHVNRVTALLGGWTVEQAKGLMQEKVPVISTSGLLGEQQHKNVFLTGMAPSRKGRILANVARARLTRRVTPQHVVAVAGGIMTWPTAIGLLAPAPPRILRIVEQDREEVSRAAVAFDKEAIKLGLPTSAIGSWAKTDVAELTRRVKMESADAIFFAGSAVALAKWRSQPHGRTLPILYAGPEGSRAELLANRGTADNIFLVTAWHPEINTPTNRRFVEQYQATFHQTPTAQAALAYESARLLFEAFRHCDGDYSAETIRKTLQEHKDFTGITGNVAFDEQRRLRRTVFALQLRRGQSILLQRDDP